MEELEMIKQRKFEQIRQQYEQQAEEQKQVEQQIAQLEMVVKTLFTKEALERYGSLKSAHPEKAVQVLVILGRAIQSGKIQKINDEMLKQILIKLTPEKKEFNIKRI